METTVRQNLRGEEQTKCAMGNAKETNFQLKVLKSKKCQCNSKSVFDGLTANTKEYLVKY